MSAGAGSYKRRPDSNAASGATLVSMLEIFRAKVGPQVQTWTADDTPARYHLRPHSQRMSTTHVSSSHPHAPASYMPFTGGKNHHSMQRLRHDNTRGRRLNIGRLGWNTEYRIAKRFGTLRV
ncbi:hypothetical protein WG66_003414 [Moniliophthora roreri]|nr:hypothetical protein WG66_003414 [Moniliophthora roreri]